MYDHETPSRLTSIQKKKKISGSAAPREKIGEIKEQQAGKVEGGEREEEWSRYFWWAIVLRNFMRARLAAPRRAAASNERNPYRIKASICTLLFYGGVRAQLTSLRESRLTRFATIIQLFRIRFSSYPFQFIPPFSADGT